MSRHVPQSFRNRIRSRMVCDRRLRIAFGMLHGQRDMQARLQLLEPSALGSRLYGVPPARGSHARCATCRTCSGRTGGWCSPCCLACGAQRAGPVDGSPCLRICRHAGYDHVTLGDQWSLVRRDVVGFGFDKFPGVAQGRCS